MRDWARLLCILSVCLGCGSKTSLRVDDAAAPAPVVESLCVGAPREPIQLLSDVRGPTHLAVFRDTLYWASWFSINGRVERVSRDGDDSRLVADSQDAPSAIAADRRGAFWLTTSALMYASRAGDVDVVVDGLNHPGDLVLFGGAIYVADGSNSGSIRDEGIGRILRVSGGDVEVLDRDLGLPTHLAVDEAAVYWTDALRGLVAKRAHGEDETIMLAEGLARPRDIEVREGVLYFSEAGERVLSLAVSGGEPTALLTSAAVIRDIEVDARHIYFGGHDYETRTAGGLYRYSHTDGLVEALDVGEDLFGIAQDETRVYWTLGEAGEVWMRCKRP